MEKKEQLKSLMFDYYKHYYDQCLKLPDWRQRVETRLDEESIFGKKVYDLLCASIENLKLENKRILIMGAGTGAELFFLHRQFNVEVYGVEPYEKAFEILQLKAQLYGLGEEKILHAAGEALPFEEHFFDLIVCFTVLEHVQDVKKSLCEMKRVLTPQGHLFIEAPNYAYPEEQHYKKAVFPPALSARIARWQLKFQGRYTPFFETLNFFSSRQVSTFLREAGLDYYRKDPPLTFPQSIKMLPIWLYAKLFQIPRNQIIVAKKG